MVPVFQASRADPPAGTRVIQACLLLVPRVCGMLVLTMLAFFNRALAEAPPATLDRTLTYGSQSVNVSLALHPIRSSQFQVMVQQADGTYVDFLPIEARTYLGSAPAYPGSIAVGMLRADGTLLARLCFEDGITLTSVGGAASVRGSAFEPKFPTLVMTAGAGSKVQAAEVGIDCTNAYFVSSGSTTATVVENCEFSVMSANMVYLRDAAILHRIGKIIIRANATQDPYAPDGGSTSLLLPRLRTLWNAGYPMGASHDLALVVHPNTGGGLAYVGAVGTSSRYSANGSDGNGDFSVVWRHEAGHNWGSGHYEGGGNPEGPTIMSDNSLGRFSSSELLRIVNHRNSRGANLLDDLGSYPFPLPPRANQDTGFYLQGGSAIVDVLANDSDSNGDALVVAEVDALSHLGGSVGIAPGTGPGGRDQVIYHAPSSATAETDWFKYRIRDASGMTATGYVMMAPRSGTLNASGRWKLDELEGYTVEDSFPTTFQGAYWAGVRLGEPGATPANGTSVYFDGDTGFANVRSTAPGGAILTYTSWIRRDGSQQPGAGIVLLNPGFEKAGLLFGEDNELNYLWYGFPDNWRSGLVVPDDTWCLAVMSVGPTGATLYLRTPSGLQSARRDGGHVEQSLNSTIRFGQDPYTEILYRGWMDDVRAFKSEFSPGDVESLYQRAVNPPVVSLESPAAGNLVSSLNNLFSARISPVDGVKSVRFTEGGAELAAVEAAPFQTTVAALGEGSHTVVARVTFSEWDYQVDSPPVTFQAPAAPLPTVSIAASLPVSMRYGNAGIFTITRDHALEAITVGVDFGGTAVRGSDYFVSSGSAVLAAGQLSATIEVQPIGPVSSGAAKTVVASIIPSASHVGGTPSAATLVLDTHILSAADGAWNVADTWGGLPAVPVTGTQNSGESYEITSTVTSNNPASNSQAFVAGGLTVSGTGILDLARLHSNQAQSASYNLPKTTIANGGTLQFRCSVGTSNHTVSAPLTFIGETHLVITGGSYGNSATLGGAISGSGTIFLVSKTSAPAGTFAHEISVTSANNPFTGNWVVSHIGGGDETALLRASASKALGTGTVTVNQASQLVNDKAGGIDSIAGVTLDGAGAALLLNQPWKNPAAALVLGTGTPYVKLSAGTSEIGNFLGNFGLVEGSSSSSALKVNQSLDAAYAGQIGAIGLIKAGPAVLTLSGIVNSGARLTVIEGGLRLAVPGTSVLSMVQQGGNLVIPLTSPEVIPVTVARNFDSTGGAIVIPPRAAPYLL